MKALIIIPLLSLALVACKDEEEEINTDYTIEGNLYQDCSNKPYSNLTLNFYDRKIGSIGEPASKDFKGQTTTDANGFYSMTANFGGYLVLVEDNQGNEVFQASINYGNTDRVTKATLYDQAVSYHPLKIFCDSSFSSDDTLYIGAKGGSYIDTFFVGPFYDKQTFDNITLYTPFISNGYTTTGANSEIETNVVWGIGKNSYDSTASNVIGREQFYIQRINQKTCSKGDTIRVNLRVIH